jgi:NADP-dependent aldehyde dehydrogenase
MPLEPVLIDGEWREARHPAGEFRAIDPATKAESAEAYPISAAADVERAVRAAEAASAALRSVAPEDIARFLDAYASKIEGAREALVAIAARETGLPAAPRLGQVELPRAVDQIRQGAAAARDRSWCQATIDTKANIRSRYGPLGGGVAVFGPNNFPFAFNSIAGGDFVAAMAAGNPVIGKANTGHPGTSKRLAELAWDAALDTGMPRGTIQLIYRTPPDVGFRLVSHPAIGATGFTGSKEAGLRLKEAADRAGKPIYLEMASTNPVFVLPGALDARREAIARELFDSCSLGAGQFCTRPGITVLPRGAQAEAFLAEAARLFTGANPGTLLGPQGPARIAEGIAELVAHGAEIVAGGRAIDGPRYAFSNTLLRASGDAFLASPHALQTEAFGTVNLVIVAGDADQMVAIAGSLEGNLTGSIYSDASGGDDELYVRVGAVLRHKVGRLLNDKMPTGVAVTPAMNHGGPFPATGHPGFTAVGIPASLLRFAALHCYDNVRPHRLPPELADRNPTGRMWRLIDGEWSTRDVTG